MILVTGGAGMIGSNLTKRLLRNEHNVKVIDNFYRGTKENLKASGLQQENFLEYDLSKGLSEVLVDFCKGVKVIYHLADIVAGIDYVFSNEYDIFNVNIAINTTVALLAEKTQTQKFIYAGTVCSFPENLQNEYEQDDALEEKYLFPAKPESGYGWSKLIGQLQLGYLSDKVNLDSITLMFHNVYGRPSDFSRDKSQVIPSIIRKVHEAKEGDKIVVWGTGNQSRAFVHVEDVVDALFSVMSIQTNETHIQIGPEFSTTINDLTAMMIEISGKELSIINDLSKPEGDKARYSNNALAYNVLQWKPKTSLYNGLKDLYESYVSAANK